MPLTIHFELAGDVQLHRTLDRFVEAVGDMRPVWEVLADRFAVIEQRQFATEGGYASGGWSPLSPAYAAWKGRHYPGKTILRRTDALFYSLTERPFGVEVITESYMVVGTAVEYAGHHQRGDGVPQRRPVEFPESERAEWARIMHRYVATGEVPELGPRGGLPRGGG